MSNDKILPGQIAQLTIEGHRDTKPLSDAEFVVAQQIASQQRIANAAALASPSCDAAKVENQRKELARLNAALDVFRKRLLDAETERDAYRARAYRAEEQSARARDLAIAARAVWIRKPWSPTDLAIVGTRAHEFGDAMQALFDEVAPDGVKLADMNAEVKVSSETIDEVFAGLATPPTPEETVDTIESVAEAMAGAHVTGESGAEIAAIIRRDIANEKEPYPWQVDAWGDLATRANALITRERSKRQPPTEATCQCNHPKSQHSGSGCIGCGNGVCRAFRHVDDVARQPCCDVEDCECDEYVERKADASAATAAPSGAREDALGELLWRTAINPIVQWRELKQSVRDAYIHEAGVVAKAVREELQRDWEMDLYHTGADLRDEVRRLKRKANRLRAKWLYERDANTPDAEYQKAIDAANERLSEVARRERLETENAREWFRKARERNKENNQLREALGYTIATIDNVLPTMAEIDDEEEAKEVEEFIDEYRKLLVGGAK